MTVKMRKISYGGKFARSWKVFKTLYIQVYIELSKFRLNKPGCLGRVFSFIKVKSGNFFLIVLNFFNITEYF